MAVLTADLQTVRKNSGSLLQVQAGIDIVYRGGLVSCLRTAGFALAGQDTADHIFQGVAYEKVDNSGGSNGDLQLKVYRKGFFKFAGTGFAQADVGKNVYIIDDQTVGVVPGNVFCGRIADFESSTEVWVDIEPAIGFDSKQTVICDMETFVGTRFAGGWICPVGQQATILSGQVVAHTIANYATSCLMNLYKYDLSGTAAEAILETADLDVETANLTVDVAVDLVLQSTTPVHLDLEQDDTIAMKIIGTGTETTAGHVTVMLQLAVGPG